MRKQRDHNARRGADASTGPGWSARAVGAVAVLLEGWAARGFLIGELAYLVPIHGLAVACAGLAGYWADGRRGWYAPACCALIAAALPCIGVLVVAVSITTLLAQRAAARGPKLVRIELPSHRVHPRPEELRPDRFTSPFQDPQADPLLAVGSLRPMPARYSVPVLRQHLEGEREDVRLLAYALIERHERNLRRQIAALRAAVEDSGRPMPPLSAKHLAQLHWDLVDGGLVSETAREQALSKARQWARYALERTPNDGPTWMLLARVELSERKAEAAARCLVRARLCGVSESAAAVLQNEIQEQGHAAAQLPAQTTPPLLAEVSGPPGSPPAARGERS